MGGRLGALLFLVLHLLEVLGVQGLEIHRIQYQLRKAAVDDQIGDDHARVGKQDGRAIAADDGRKLLVGDALHVE